MLTYDLNSKGQKYDEIIDCIKNKIATNNVWCTFWKSSFLISSDKTPNEMLEILKPYLDSNDKFFVSEIVNNNQGWLTEKEWEYINQNIFG
ncbi:hypothetical protein MT409_01000 [Mammaliicoccus sciuri]|nr:hypothetical protein [Mammaliicoccus sciuri]MCJ1757870.1 hypothetical protein [Mammaliicoccus sciuri]